MQPAIWSMVVLPEPDGPVIITTSPRRTVSLIFLRIVQDPLRLVVVLVDLVEPQDRFSGTHVRNASPGSVLITFRIESSELRAEQSAVVPTPASTSSRVMTVEMVVSCQEHQGHVEPQPGEAAADEEHDDDLEHEDRDDLGARGVRELFMHANIGNLSTVEM